MPRLDLQAHVIKSDFITYNLIGFINVQLIKGRNLSFQINYIVLRVDSMVMKASTFFFFFVFEGENNLRFEPKNTWALIFQSLMLLKVFAGDDTLFSQTNEKTTCIQLFFFKVRRMGLAFQASTCLISMLLVLYLFFSFLYLIIKQNYF